MSSQVCQLLHVIEGKPMMRRVSKNFVGENYATFNNVEELQENNVKLVGLVRELSAAIDQIDTSRTENVNKEVEVESKPSQDEKMETSIIENKEVLELSQKLQQSEENLEKLKLKHEEILSKKEKVIEQLNNQLDQIKSQLSDTSGTNFKLRAEVEQKEGQLKIQQKNFDVTKRRLQSLEDKSKNSGITVAKLETSLAHLRDEHQICVTKLSKAEISVGNLTKENKNLIKLEAHLRAENDMHKKQQQMQSQMMSSLESIKATLERQENEKCSTKMAEKINEMSEKCEELEKIKNKYLKTK